MSCISDPDATVWPLCVVSAGDGAVATEGLALSRSQGDAWDNAESPENDASLILLKNESCEDTLGSREIGCNVLSNGWGGGLSVGSGGLCVGGGVGYICG